MLYALVSPDWHDLPISTRGLDFQWISNYLHKNLFGYIYSGISPSSKSMSTVRCNYAKAHCLLKPRYLLLSFDKFYHNWLKLINLEIQCF